MAEIKSAYRFIPVNKNQKYFSPEWKYKVSLDIPFEKEVSGIITYTLKASTPIFVKGHDGFFCNVKGKYFIPGTTIKGCIRSVLEIMSFGHLDETRVKNNNEPYSFRDIQDRNGYMQKMCDVYCGWLTKDGKIIQWGKPVQIKYDSIVPKIANCNFNTFRNLSVTDKYRKTHNEYLTGKFSEPQRLQGARSFDQRRFCQFDDNGKNGGTVIFSGAMQNKKSDFVLLDRDAKGGELTVNENVLSVFKKIYSGVYENIPYNPKTGGKAIFFTLEGDEVKTIGLSYLHKYFANNQIRDAIPTELRGGDMDMADVIFGSTDHNLKGRVQFSAAKQWKNVEPLLADDESILNVLGSPRASYYPTYLQNKATWDSSDAIISGIKRYPIKPRYDINPLLLTEQQKKDYEQQFGNVESKLNESVVGNRKMIPRDQDNRINFETISRMRPLKENSSFKGAIRFHNLKQEELGALLSALTFHGKETECKHSLGQAKAYGYGSVSICIDEFKTNQTDSKQDYLIAFEKLMDSQMCKLLGENIKWKDSHQIKELFAMAKGFDDSLLVDIFTPMLLEDFGKVKGKYMQEQSDFSSYIACMNANINISSSSFTSQKKIASQTFIAKISVWQGQLKQAKLTEGKDLNAKPLIVSDKKTRLKVGDLIEVEKVIRGGNVKELRFKKKC